jgi:hypothetical protein
VALPVQTELNILSITFTYTPIPIIIARWTKRSRDSFPFCSALVPLGDVDGGAEAGAGAADPAGGAQPGAARQGPGDCPRHLPQEGHRHIRPLQKCGGERGPRAKAYTHSCRFFKISVVFIDRQI